MEGSLEISLPHQKMSEKSQRKIFREMVKSQMESGGDLVIIDGFNTDIMIPRSEIKYVTIEETPKIKVVIYLKPDSFSSGMPIITLEENTPPTSKSPHECWPIDHPA